MSYPSIIAGVVDGMGGFRVVVTQPWLVHHHVNEGERAVIVPRLTVREPVAWDKITDVIEIVKKHIAYTGARHG